MNINTISDELNTGSNNNINESNVNVMVRQKSYSLIEGMENKVPIDCSAINKQQQCFKNKLNVSTK